MKDGLHIDDLGDKYWSKNGKLHRDNDLPAVESTNGTKCWYQHGKIHRDNDLPACEYYNVTKYWYQNGKLHRENDLPAIEGYDGTKYWYQNDNAHRIGNTSIIYHDNTERFHINGIEYTKENYWKEVGKNYGLIISNKVKI